MLNEVVGKNIKKLRELKGFSQDAVEIELDISHPTYSRIENGVGKIDLDRVEKIAAFLGVDVPTLLNFSEKDSYKSSPPPQIIEEKAKGYDVANIELAKNQETIKALKDKIELLEEKLKDKEEKINDKETIIKLLTGELWTDAAKAAKKLRESKKNK